jgi:UDP-glucose 4-epimerase
VGHRILVTGASGNLGARVVDELARDREAELVVGLARRRPQREIRPGVVWRELDLTPPSSPLARDPLDEVLEGIDTVVHLAWLIQPTRDVTRQWEVNVRGTERLLTAIAGSEVRTIVHASSVGAYSPPRDPAQPVDETWPTHGIATSHYSLAKAYVERLLDRFEEQVPEVAVRRLRPGLVLQRGAAAHVRRLFLGALAPARSIGRGRVPVVPDIPGLAASVVHTEDAARAVRAAIHAEVDGAFNLAAPDPVTARDLAALFGARRVRVPRRVARAATSVAFATRLAPVGTGWFDLAFASPLLDASRAARELGWVPTWSAHDALRDVLAGLADGAGEGSPPLEGDAHRSRLGELAAVRQGADEVP